MACFNSLATRYSVGSVVVCLQLIFSPESQVALLFALWVGAQKVAVGKVVLQIEIIVVVHVLVEFITKVACQVLTPRVVEEQRVVEEVLLAEVTPGVR